MRGWGNPLSKFHGITIFPSEPEFMPSIYKNKNPRELAKNYHIIVGTKTKELLIYFN